MAKFIQVTPSDSRYKIRVNVDHITWYGTVNENDRQQYKIHFISDTWIYVDEDTKMIDSLIAGLLSS